MASVSRTTADCNVSTRKNIPGLHRARSVPSSPWQGNVFKHMKNANARRLVLSQGISTFPHRATRSTSRDIGIEKRKWRRTMCEVTQADASTLSVDLWSNEGTIDLVLPEIPENEGVEDGHQSLEASLLMETVDGGTQTTSAQPAHVNNVQGDKQTASSASSAQEIYPELKQKSEFWKILHNDIKLMKNAFEDFKEVVFPTLTETVQEIVTLRLWEDPSASQSAAQDSLPQPYRPGLSGLDLATADFIAAKAYLQMPLGWIRSFQIPLKHYYDPDLIAAYFHRRPHILLFRILQVTAVFGSAVFQLELEKFSKPADMTESNIQRRGAELIKEALISLGPIFIKVGQSLSTRPDLIEAIPAKVFSEMQDSLPPFPTREALSIIEEELGCPINTLFCQISENPVAAASFGQVYKGKTIEGQDVAIKVQRPNLLLSIALDVYILRMGLDLVRKIAKRRSDLKLYADELGHGFFGELDYVQEAENALEFKEAHSKLTFIEVPETLRGLSTRRVLTMKWIDGDRPVDLLQVAEMPNPNQNVELEERQLRARRVLFSMVNKGVEASLVQLFDSGVLHADPHPGNMLYTEEGKMVFLDFGLLCRMKEEHQLAMMASVTHIVNADWDSFVQDLASMDVLPNDINRGKIVEEIAQSLGDMVPQEGIPDIKFSKVLSRVLSIALRHQFQMPPYFILVLRSIASLEGLALAVDPNFNVFASSYPFVLQKLLTEQSVPFKRVLSSLVLDRKNRFRWDRVASFATIAQQRTQKMLALEAGEDLKLVPPADGKIVNSQLLQLLANLLLSEKGIIFRQLILEADTYDLARMFNSRKAGTVRRNVASAIANAFYQMGQKFLKEHSNIFLQDTTLLGSTQSLVSTSAGEKALVNDFKSMTDCSDTLDVSLLRNKHMQVLLQVLILRLRRKPLLLVQTGWTSFSIFCYALALAAHRLVVALCFKMLSSKSDSISLSGYKLTPA